MRVVIRSILIAALVLLASCRPVHSMGGHVTCPLKLPANVRDYRGASQTESGHGEWYDLDGRLFGYALEEDSDIYKNERCL